MPLKPLSKWVKATVAAVAAAAYENLKDQFNQLLVERNALSDVFHKYQKSDCGYSHGFKCF